MYNRLLKHKLLELSEQWSVISVTGPRQSGKTTLCKMAFPQYGYVNLEHLPTRRKVESDPEEFLLSHKNGLIIDEAQYMPDLFSYIQVLVDDDKSLRYILSGSSDFLLMQNITQSLAGRVSVQRLLPLSLSEIGEEKDINTDELMFKGFYPAIWGDKKNPNEVYESYFSTYLERDVRQIINIQNLSSFVHFVRLCAGRIGNEFNANSISGEVGVSNVTIQHWMSILETSYTAFRLQPFYKNIGKRLIKSPKIYFYDVGLVCHLLDIHNVEQLRTHPLRGAIFENMIVVEMLKSRLNTGKTNNLFFYRDKGQHEVDVIQEFGMELRAYEIKSATMLNNDFFKNLKYVKDIIGKDLISTQVIYDGKDEWDKPDNGYLNFRHWKESDPWN